MGDTILLELAVEAERQGALAGAGIVVLDEDELLHSIFADCMVILQIMENIARINILYFHNFNDSALPKFARSKQNQGRDGHSAFGTLNIKKILPDRFRPQFERQKYVWQGLFVCKIHVEAALAPPKGDATIRPSFEHPLPRGVMVTQEILILSFKVRILARQPLGKPKLV